MNEALFWRMEAERHTRSSDPATGTTEDSQHMSSRDALVAVRQEALESLIGRIARRYGLRAGEIGVLLNGLKDLTEERIIVMHQILDRAIAAERRDD